jgi:hypothetical protein
LARREYPHPRCVMDFVRIPLIVRWLQKRPWPVASGCRLLIPLGFFGIAVGGKWQGVYRGQFVGFFKL